MPWRQGWYNKDNKKNAQLQASIGLFKNESRVILKEKPPADRVKIGCGRPLLKFLTIIWTKRENGLSLKMRIISSTV